MVKVFINPGHGGKDPGAVGNGLKEKDVVLKIAKEMRKELQKYNNVTIKMFRSNDTYYSLSRIAQEANKWGADIFVSIHVNAGGGTGFESYIYNGKVSHKTVNNQVIIHKEIMKNISGVRDRGFKEKNLAVLRQTKMPAILTECLFIDTKADADKLKQSSFIDALAKGHAAGVAKALGLKKKAATPVAKPNEKTFYRVVTGSFSDRANAEKRLNELKKAGFDSFIDKYSK